MPEFPDFIPIDLDVKHEIIRFTSMYPMYSDYNFVSLFSWNVDGDMSASFLNDNLILKFRDYISGKPCLSFLGEKHVVKTAQTLIEFAKKENMEPYLKYVPDSVVKYLKQSSLFDIEEDRDNHDYLISLPQLTTAQGRPYKHFRRSIKLFNKVYAPHTKVFRLDLNDRATQSQIKELLLQTKYRKPGHNEAEVLAVERLLDKSGHFNLMGFGIEIADNLVGFIIVELLLGSRCIGHFWHCDQKYEGIYRYFMYQVGSYLNELEYEFMNIEQDLGIDGLRLAKEHLVPKEYLKKFMVHAIIKDYAIEQL